MFRKFMNITQQNLGYAVWHWYALSFFAGHHWALMTLVFTDNTVWYCFTLPFFAGYHLSHFILRTPPKNFWGCNDGFLPLPLMVSSGSTCHCWSGMVFQVDWAAVADSCKLSWRYPDNEDWIPSKELFLSRSMAFVLLSFSFYCFYWVVVYKGGKSI